MLYPMYPFMRRMTFKSLREARSKGKKFELEGITDLRDIHRISWTVWLKTGEVTLRQEWFK